MANRTRSKRSRGLEVELLESRTLLAGNVTAAVIGTNLVITGDDLDNDVRIDQDDVPTADCLRISSGDFSPTTINGTAGPVLSCDLNPDVRVLDVLITLKQGNDRANLVNPAIPRDVRIDGGTGDNVVQVFNFTSIGRHLIVKNSNGSDLLSVVNVSIGGKVNVSNGKGGSSIFVVSSSVGGAISVKNSDGDDMLAVI